MDILRSTDIFFNVKMDFTCKACYVAGGNLINPTENVPIYDSVVS